ncbi:MAG: hypothetical protein M1832_000447 [Thelocarpon impressellum]|nr:MAG: hypothetical protein M1832_000447 [Thelocarpon impressellum]
MAPDRGRLIRTSGPESGSDDGDPQARDEASSMARLRRSRSDAGRFLAEHAASGQNFTARGVLVGCAVGIVICFSNMYFGLQTGWVSGMTMPASLIGFAFFKSLGSRLDGPFTPVENVLVQTVAGAVGTMPLGSGFVGVVPAIEYLLKPGEGGPLQLSLWRLVVWSLGLCFFGVFFAVPLRREVIIREKLKFPSGTATALMIGVLHGSQKGAEDDGRSDEESRLLGGDEGGVGQDASVRSLADTDQPPESGTNEMSGWRSKVRLLVISFAISGSYTLVTYFVPVLRKLPILGVPLATKWLWSLNPAPAYIGQGIIMGPATTLHMFLGAVVGWGILSPLAKTKGWAPGAVEDWENGSKGWIVWVSLAIMLADSIVSLAWLALKPVVKRAAPYVEEASRRGYTALAGSPGADDASASIAQQLKEVDDMPDVDAPPEHLIGNRTVCIGLVVSILFCIVCIHITFGTIIPLYATITAVLMALLLSIMGVRALGETDLNPVSGISKLTQLFFALLIPSRNKHGVLINLIAGAVSESGALQAGDMLQDLKTGHLLGASPRAQFYGQLIGSAVGAVASAFIYRLYTGVYEVPGEMFQVPTGFVWVFTARLVTGDCLPVMAREFAAGAAGLFAIATAARIIGAGKRWHPFIPGGIAVAVGMYNVPSFTLARTIGGLGNWYWCAHLGREETPVIVLASGLILGEGVVSIVNLVLASLSVPHL